ncbi:MAG TPA: TonB-dependent receptor [Povalibacter sp.]|uniref:TonB-dependent receptor n=1 Tax=Povalibacter sp. TaxID=1962978 RepID=UPI002B8875A6|nr:TonB-dependent receptor [Povalibacter sp.]HMN45043.1 TonB-dependent receptor [Povalibacter sp.]
MTDILKSAVALTLLCPVLPVSPVEIFFLSNASAAEQIDEVVVTATRRAEQLRDFAGSISIVSDRDVAMVGSTHHAEIMNRAAGTMIQRNSGEESLTAIRSPVLSGPGSCGVFLFLENSVPIRPVGFCNVNELFEVNTEEAQSIEVLRGPAGVVYGSGAMHGAINVLQATPAQLPSVGLGLESGPDEFYRGKFAFGHTGTSTDVGVVGLASHDGGWRDDSGLEEQKLNAQLIHRGDDALMGLSLAATNLNQETAGFIQGEDAYKDESIKKSNPNPEAYRDAYAVRLTGQYQRQLSDTLQLDLRPYVRHSRMDFLQHFLVGKPTEENGQDSIGLLSSLHIDAFTNTSILAGIDLEFAEGFLKETQDGPATDGTPAANDIRPAGKHYDYTVDSSVAAIYAQLDQPFAQRWKFSAGVRVEYVDYDYDNRMIAGNTRDDGTPCPGTGCLYSRPADRSDDFTSPTGKIGLTYSINDSHAIYATATHGYRAPDTSELYRLQRQQSIADLDAEELDSIEIGARGQFASLRYSLAAFDMTKDNVIFRDANAFNVSDGRTKHRGVEYEFSWAIVDSLRLALAGTYAEHTYDFNRSVEQGETIVAGRDVDTAPRHVNTARIDWRPLDSLGAELEWVGVGRYYVDAANAHEYEGHDLLNLRLAWNATAHWTGIVRVNNLTDEDYADRADYAFGNYRYFPGRDRTVFVEVNYRTE